MKKVEINFPVYMVVYCLFLEKIFLSKKQINKQANVKFSRLKFLVLIGYLDCMFGVKESKAVTHLVWVSFCV